MITKKRASEITAQDPSRVCHRNTAPCRHSEQGEESCKAHCQYALKDDSAVRHKGTVLIETERLKLRRFTSYDTHAVYENWASLPEVAEFLSWKPHSNLRVTEQLVATWVHQYKFDTNYNWAIELKDGKQFRPISFLSAAEQSKGSSGRNCDEEQSSAGAAIILEHSKGSCRAEKAHILVGNIAVTRRTEESAELAYLIAPRFWGMGFAAESVKAVCTFLFNEVGFTRIILNIPNENAKSRRVAEKCGFSLVSISPHAATDHSGKSLDICNYELKSNNFKKGLR